MTLRVEEVQMRSFCAALLMIAILVVPATHLFGQTSAEHSVAQLKEEIRKLQAIDRDESTSAEVRVLNQIFIKQRRVELRALLTKNIASLRKYLTTVETSLRPEEKLIVQNTIDNAEKDLQSLTEANEAAAASPSTNAHVNSEAPVDATPTADRPSGAGNGNGNGNGNTVSSTTVTDSVVAAAPSSAVTSAPQSTSLNAELNARIKAKAQTLSRARVDQTDNTNQTETPSVSGASSSLVDQSSASDLIGLAANFAGLAASSNNNQPEPSSISVTTSAYTLLAAIKQVDPLNPVFYDQHGKWRNFAITLGYDDEDQPDGTKQRAKIFGGKFMFVNRRDPTLKRNQIYIERVGNSLEEAAKAFGDIAGRVRGLVMSMEAVRRNLLAPGFKNFLEKRKPTIELQLDRATASLNTAKAASAAAPNDTAKKDAAKDAQARVDAIQAHLDSIQRMIDDPGNENLFVLGPNFLPTASWSREELEYRTEFLNQFLGPDYRQKLGPDVAKAVDELLDRTLKDSELKEFTDLDDVTRDAVERIRRAPQFSVGFLTKQRRIGIDEYLGQLIFDYGLANRVNLTLNGAYRYNDTNVIGGDVRGASFSGQLRFQLNRENLLGKKPFFFDLSTQGNWMNGTDSIYKAQGKLTIPIADGIEFPISVTYANRTELIKEKEVRGQFGFTVDTARLIRAFLFR
jgi:hypothetical protein